MANKKNIYIGLMTGTSIDAIDAVAVRFLNNSIDRSRCKLCGYLFSCCSGVPGYGDFC